MVLLATARNLHLRPVRFTRSLRCGLAAILARPRVLATIGWTVSCYTILAVASHDGSYDIFCLNYTTKIPSLRYAN